MWCLAWVAALQACASTPASRPGTQAMTDVWLGDGQWRLPSQVGAEAKRESPDARAHPVVLESLQGAPTAQVVSLVQPTALDAPSSGGAAFRALLGEDASAECLVRKDRLDVASAMRGVVADVTTRPTVSHTAVSLPPPRGVGNTAVLQVTVEYLTPTGRYGALRLAGTNVRGVGVFCSLEAPGHALTFGRMVATLVQSLDVGLVDEATARASYLVTMDGGWVGTAEQAAIQRPNSKPMDLQFVSLLRVHGVALQSVDEVGVELTDAEGTLLLLRSMRRENGEMVREGALTRFEDGRVGLKLHQDERPADLGRANPTGMRALQTHLAQAQQQPAQPRTFLRYLPGMDPRALAEETVLLQERTANGARFSSTLATQAGRAEAQYLVDAQGILQSSTVRWNDTQLTITRVDNR